MQGGQGDIKHWAFNDPPRREGRYTASPPAPDEYLALTTRMVDLHPITIAQNARTSGGGNVTLVPTQAMTVGPVETWQAEKVSIWHAGTHDNPFGQRLTTLMISTACGRHRGADVPSGRAPQRAVQLLPRRDRHVRGGDALKAVPVASYDCRPIMPIALAVFAHPDDIELTAAGTLVRLQRAGYRIHYMTVANGSCGSSVHARKGAGPRTAR